MLPKQVRHPDEEQIESYSLGVLPEESTAPLEEHLLVCELCQNRVAETDAYIAALRTAAKEPQPEISRPERSSLRFIPAAATAMGLALLVWAGLRTGRMNAPMPAVAVTLEANRGVIEAHAPAGKPLALRLDLEGLPQAGGTFFVEIVNGNGGRVWKGEATADRTAQAAVPGLTSGVYFVRVSTRAGELLREYGLEVGLPR